MAAVLQGEDAGQVHVFGQGMPAPGLGPGPSQQVLGAGALVGPVAELPAEADGGQAVEAGLHGAAFGRLHLHQLGRLGKVLAQLIQGPGLGFAVPELALQGPDVLEDLLVPGAGEAPGQLEIGQGILVAAHEVEAEALIIGGLVQLLGCAARLQDIHRQERGIPVIVQPPDFADMVGTAPLGFRFPHAQEPQEGKQQRKSRLRHSA